MYMMRMKLAKRFFKKSTFHVLCSTIKSYWNANFSIKIHFITPWKYAFDVIKMTPHTFYYINYSPGTSREVPLGIYFSNYKKIPREIHISSNICGSCLDICKSLLILFMVVINVFFLLKKTTKSLWIVVLFFSIVVEKIFLKLLISWDRITLHFSPRIH